MNIHTKISTYMLGITTLALAFSGVAFAEGTTVSGSVTTQPGHDNPRPVINAIVHNVKTDIQHTIQQEHATTVELRAQIASSTHDIESDHKQIASTTQALRKDVKDIRVDIQTQRHNDLLISTIRVAWIRVSATIVRLSKIVDKLDTRITKVKAAGNDTTAAEGYSAGAKTALAAANTDITTIKNIFLTLSSTTPLDSTATSTIHTAGQDAQTQLQTAQTDITKALQSIAGLKANENVSASTTAIINQ